MTKIILRCTVSKTSKFVMQNKQTNRQTGRQTNRSHSTYERKKGQENKNEYSLRLIMQMIHYTSILNTRFENRVQPGYNDIGLYDTSPVTPHIPCYQLIPHRKVTILGYRDTHL